MHSDWSKINGTMLLQAQQWAKPPPPKFASNGKVRKKRKTYGWADDQGLFKGGLVGQEQSNGLDGLAHAHFVCDITQTLGINFRHAHMWCCCKLFSLSNKYCYFIHDYLAHAHPVCDITKHITKHTT